MRKRSEVRKNHPLPDTYQKHETLIMICSITVLLVTTFCVLSTELLFNKMMKIQEDPLKIQTVDTSSGHAVVVTYYTNHVELYDGQISFVDRDGKEITLPTAIITVNQINGGK